MPKLKGLKINYFNMNSINSEKYMIDESNTPEPLSRFSLLLNNKKYSFFPIKNPMNEYKDNTRLTDVVSNGTVYGYYIKNTGLYKSESEYGFFPQRCIIIQ